MQESNFKEERADGNVYCSDISCMCFKREISGKKVWATRNLRTKKYL